MHAHMHVRRCHMSHTTGLQNPEKLMPRFASSFIAFLALQSFVTRITDIMPKNLDQTTWMDHQIFTTGVLMTLAVLENVLVQALT